MNITEALRKVTESIWSKTTENLRNKVDKIDGKSLSTNDYTEADRKAVGSIATDLTLLDGKLFLSKDGELLSNGVTLPSGGGGGMSSEYIALVNELDSSTVTAAVNSDVVLKFNYASEADEGGGGTAYVYVNDVLKLTTSIVAGSNSINIGAYVGEGTSMVKLTCVDKYSNSKSLSYTTNIISLRITSTFNDAQTYSGDINVRYIAYGAVEKVVHFVLGETEYTVTTTETGKQQTYVIPKLMHGVHPLQVYTTAEINGVLITSNILHFEIMAVEENTTTPLISSVYTVKRITQGELVSIPFMVYDPANLEAHITLSVLKDNEVYFTTERTVDATKQVWNVRDYPVGTVSFVINYGVITKMHTITVLENNINISIKESDLEFQLLAAGKSNEDNDREVWADGDVTTTFEYVNWENSGWVQDAEGETALRLFGDARATINFQPFKTDARSTGRTLEFIYAVRDVNNRDAVAISCLSNGVGFTATADKARLSTEQTSISCRYVDEEKIHVAFVIEDGSQYRLMYVYLDGVLSGVQQYPALNNIEQKPAVNITIGSEYCSIDVYAIRSYSTALTHDEIRDNYIASISNITKQLAVYANNDIYDIYGNISFDKVKDKICTLTIVGTLPTYKGDKRNVSISYIDPFNESFNFSDSATIDIQGTSSADYIRKNWKIKASESHQFAEGQMSGRIYCTKVDYMDSSGARNTVGANFAHTLYRDVKTPPQETDDRCRTTIYGHPAILFHKETATSDPTFLGKANMNWDKGSAVFGFDEELYPECRCWEFCNSTSDACLFHGPIPEDFGDDFEARFPDESKDIASFRIMHDWVTSTWQDGATNELLEEEYVGVDGAIYSNDTAEYRLAKFKKEFEEHFNLDFCLIYYGFVTLILAMDNLVKNCFFTTWDGVIWEPWLYDLDSCLSLNNEGQEMYDYYHVYGDYLDGYPVYNGSSSAFWSNFTEVFTDRIAATYAEWRSSGLVSYDKLVDAYITNHADKFAEAVYVEDQDFKYISMCRDNNNATYLYLTRGNGEHHLRYFFDARLMFLDSMYNCGNYPNNTIALRIYTPDAEMAIEPNHDFTLTSYSNVYLGVKYKANGTLMQQRVEKNTPTLFEAPNETFSDTETYLYPASEISSIGDISAMYCGYLDVSKATKLTELVVGAGGDYINTNLKELSVGANNLLKKIDIRNCPNLVDPLAISHCPSIEEIYAEGSGITAVELPSSGFLRVMHLPATLTNLTVKNQTHIEDFTLEGYSALTTLHVENAVNIPVEDIMLNASSLNRIRLIDVEWTAESEEALIQTINKFKSCLGIDANGNNTDLAVITGRVYVNETVSAETISDAYEVFPNLIIVDAGSSEPYIITYKDWNGDTLYADRLADGDSAIDPIAEGYISAPSRAADEYYSYEFVGWSTLPTDVDRHYVITAQYKTLVAVNFAVDGVIKHTEYVNYGTHATDPVQSGAMEAPTKEGSSTIRYIFDGWDGSLQNITLPRTINAKFANVFPVEFYAKMSARDPIYTLWVKENDPIYDPVAAGECDAPSDEIDYTAAGHPDIRYVFSGWLDMPDVATKLERLYANRDIYYAVRLWNESKLHFYMWILGGIAAVQPDEGVIGGDGAAYAVPTKKSTAEYEYDFLSWSGRNDATFGTAITESVDFDATYYATKRRYPVMFYNGNTLIQTVQNVQYGSSATYTGATPVKTGVDNPDEYVFKGWDPEPTNIAGETKCYAIYKFTGYLFGRLAETEDTDQGWGTVDNPNWDAINAYWDVMGADSQAYMDGTMSQDDFRAKYPIGGRMIIKPTGLDAYKHPTEHTGMQPMTDVEIVAHDHDNLTDGGKAPLTFFCVDVPNIAYQMNTSAVNIGGWRDSAMRTFVNGELFDALPDNLQSAIKTVDKMSDLGSSDAERSLITTPDKCWLASYDELGFSKTGVTPQGDHYASIFTNNTSRIKYVFGTASACGWWTRSSTYYYEGTTFSFYRVQKSGILYVERASNNQVYVAFGFCV